MKKNINTYLGIFLIISLFFGGLTYADSNGIWQFANDTRGGIFGGDEQGLTTSYTFINPVYFDKPLISYTNPSFKIDLKGRTQLNDLVSNNLTTNSGKINGNLIVINSISSPGTISGGTLSSSGTITGTSISSPGTISGGTLSSSGTITGTSISSPGTISAGTLSSSGTITGASISSPGTISGGTLSSSGIITGASISSPGTISANQVITNVIKSNSGQNVVIQLG